MRARDRTAFTCGVGALLVATAVATSVGMGARASGQEASQWVFGDLTTPTEMIATPRIDPAITAAPDGEQQVYYGGLDPDDFSGDAYADTWTWMGGEWTARCGTTVPGATDPCGPGPRLAHAMATGPAGALLFGGASQFPGAGPTPTLFTDTWRWDDASSSWTEVCTSQGGADPCGPGAEFLPSMAGNGTAAVLFGGVDIEAGPAPVDDTWVFDGTDWTQICGTGIGTPCGPIARAGAALAWDGSQWVLFSGTNADPDPTVYGDAWVLDGTPEPGDTWTQVCAEGACGPVGRPGGGFAHLARPDDPSLRGAVLYGGVNLGDPATIYRDAWFWDGAAFSQLDVPWDDSPLVFTGDPSGNSGVAFSSLGSRFSQCQVVLTGITFDESAGSRLGGWDLDGSGGPGDCSEVAPTTTTTSPPAPTTTAATPAPSTEVTTPPPTLPATGPGADRLPLVATLAGGLVLGGLLVAAARRRGARPG